MKKAIRSESYTINRRYFFLSSIAAFTVFTRNARADGAAGDPWSQSELIEPATLAKELVSDSQQIHIICVTFPFLYEAKHVPHAQFAVLRKNRRAWQSCARGEKPAEERIDRNLLRLLSNG